MDCIFCKIAKGEIPSTTVYEDNDFRVIQDINPANLGHCLILPKTHAANIYELSEELTGKAFMLAKKIAAAVQKATDCDGVNILQNNGETAGQTVFHFHIHVIPRLKGDDVKLGFGSFKTDSESIAAMGERIKNNL